jgi:hypothetical protein
VPSDIVGAVVGVEQLAAAAGVDAQSFLGCPGAAGVPILALARSIGRGRERARGRPRRGPRRSRSKTIATLNLLLCTTTTSLTVILHSEQKLMEYTNFEQPHPPNDPAARHVALSSAPVTARVKRTVRGKVDHAGHAQLTFVDCNVCKVEGAQGTRHNKPAPLGGSAGHLMVAGL